MQDGPYRLIRTNRAYPVNTQNSISYTTKGIYEACGTPHMASLGANRISTEPISKVRFRLSAEIPSLPVAKYQQAENQTVSGVRVRSKIVPAVTDVRLPHSVHMNLPSSSRHPPGCPHAGQMKPEGHLNHSR
jgi:hypothetical protein